MGDKLFQFYYTSLPARLKSGESFKVSATIGRRRRLAYTCTPCIFPFITFASPRFLCHPKRWATEHLSLLVIRFRFGTCERLSDALFKRSSTGSKIEIAMDLLVRNKKLVSRYATSHCLLPSYSTVVCFSMLVSDDLGLSEFPN
jgi:hypothetical protein